MKTLLLIALAFTAGCLRTTEFHCTTSADCGAAGQCEATHYCSFADDKCSGGRRYGELSGSLTNACVEGGGVVDAGVGIDAVVVDSPPSSGCSAQYTALPNVPTHRYKVLTTAAPWMTQKDACAADGPNVYLAIPNDMTEAQQLVIAGGAMAIWVGLDDLVTEGSFLTVLGAPATYLPWLPGQPDDAPPGEDCVAAHNMSAKFSDERCTLSMRAVCECEP